MNIFRPNQRIYDLSGTIDFKMQTGAEEAAGWWLAGGISAANCVGAWQGIGAANQAASYINLNNPGTNDLTLGAAGVTWDVTKGWLSDGLGWLDTGLNTTANYTIIVRVIDCVAGLRGPFSDGNIGWFPRRADGGCNFFEPYTTYAGKGITAGWGATANANGYVNGETIATNLNGYIISRPIRLLIAQSAAYSSVYGKLCAAAAYSIALDLTQATAVGTAMMALP